MNRFLSLVLILFTSCQIINNDENDNIAKFNDYYLTSDEFSKLMKNYNEEDSSLTANNVINDWAIDKLLIERAKLNLADSKLNEIDALVKDYKSDLLSDSYLEALVNSSVDIDIDSLEIQSLFEKNKDLFVLNNDIFRLVYIELPLDFSDTYEIRKRIKRYKSKDQLFLDSISYRYKSYSFDSDTWVPEKKLKNDFDFLTTYSYKSLKNYKFYQYKDSISLYLIKIVDLAKKGEVSPIENVFSTLEYMSLNQRKKELILKIKTDILKDALSTNKLEIY